MRIVLFLFLCAAELYAQDPFEIHVYEYEPLPPRTFTYEAHMNYVAKGAEGFHFSSEVTAGVTDDFRAAVVLLTAKRPDGPYEYAGFRVLPHIYAPQRWHLPLNLGFVAEFSFAKAAYVDNPWQVELRPIVEKHIGRLQLDANPVVSRRPARSRTSTKVGPSSPQPASAGSYRGRSRRAWNITAPGPTNPSIKYSPAATCGWRRT